MRVVAGALALLAAIVPTPARAADERAVLTVVSHNVLHGGPWSGFAGDGQRLERRMALIADELASLRPDVIALQEAAVSRRLGDVTARLARRLGYHHVHAPATPYVFGEGILSRLVVGALGFREGPAILSRFPILQSEVYELPRCQNRLDPRVLLRARLDTPWGPIDVFSAHTWRDECQARRVTALVAASRNGLPSVLMGDFNAVESSPAIRAMTGRPASSMRIGTPTRTPREPRCGNGLTRRSRRPAGGSTTSSWCRVSPFRAAWGRAGSFSTPRIACPTAPRYGPPITTASWPSWSSRESLASLGRGPGGRVPSTGTPSGDGLPTTPPGVKGRPRGPFLSRRRSGLYSTPLYQAKQSARFVIKRDKGRLTRVRW